MDPSDKEEIDSITLLLAGAVNRLGQSGTEFKAALQMWKQAAAKMEWQQQEVPKPTAMAATSTSSKGCKYGCQESHKLEKCPKFLRLSPNFCHLLCMRWELCLSCLEERHGEDLKRVSLEAKGEPHNCRQGGGKCEKCGDWHHPLTKCPKFRPSRYEDAEEEDRKAMAAAANAASGLRWKPIQMLAQTIKLSEPEKELNAF